MTRALGFAIALLSMACSGARVGSDQDHTTVTFPNRAEPKQGERSAAPAPSGAPSSSAVATSSPPADPPPLSSVNHLRLELQYARGAIRVSKVEAVHLDQAREGDRRTGRFALELWSDQTLLDRLRFDFPLLAAETPSQSSERPLRRDALFGPGAEVATTLQLASVPEITRAQVVDRTTGQITGIPWPPAVAPTTK